MSELAGIAHLDGRPVDRHALERMARALARHHPVYQRQVVEGAFGVVYGGCGITPEERFEQQPAKLADGRWLVFCGRLDNRQELVHALGLRPAEAGRQADSALAALAWQRWSSDSLARWIGPHATVVWSARQRQLTLARGAPVGLSLISHRRGPTVYFASSLDLLFALPAVPRQIDEGVLADLLMGTRSESRFLYSGIDSVPSAGRQVWTQARSFAERYWTPDPRRRESFTDEAECHEAFAELFRTAVQSHLRAAGPVGILLSGGLDSASVAAQACRILAGDQADLNSYTRVPLTGARVGSPGALDYHDESPKVRMLARRYANLRPRWVEPPRDGVFDGLEDWFTVNQTPSLQSPTMLSGHQALLKKAADDGVKVLLDAGCGNLTISYNGHGRLRELFVRGRWLRLRRELGALARHGFDPGKLLNEHVFSPLMPGPIHRLRLNSRLRRAKPWQWFSSIHPDFARDSGALDRAVGLQNFRLFWSNWSSWRQRARPFLDSGQIGQWGGAERLFGFEQRDPTADRRIVEFCLALPERYFLDHGVNRRLVRVGLADLLPEGVREDYRIGRHDVDWLDRLQRDWPALEASIDQLRNDPDISRWIDVERLDRLARELQEKPGRQWSRRQTARFKLALLGPIHVAKFLRWHRGRND